MAQQAAEQGFAKADDEDEVETGDDEVVGGDVEVGVLVHPDALGNGSHVGDAAGVDADGHGAYLGKLARVALSAEEEESNDGDNEHGE